MPLSIHWGRREFASELRKARKNLRGLVSALQTGDVGAASNYLARYRARVGFRHDLHYFLLTDGTGVATLWSALLNQTEWFDVHCWKVALIAYVEHCQPDAEQAIEEVFERLLLRVDHHPTLLEECIFAAAVALVRRGDTKAALSLAQRRLDGDPVLLSAIECLVGSREDRELAIQTVERLAPGSGIAIAGRALLQPPAGMRTALISALHQSKLNVLNTSALCGYLPRCTDGSNTLFVARGRGDRSAAFAFVVERDASAATKWIEEFSGHSDTVVAPLYPVRAEPTLSLPWTLPVNGALVRHENEHWTIRDCTGVSKLTWTFGLGKHLQSWWQSKPKLSPLPELYERAFATGLLTL